MTMNGEKKLVGKVTHFYKKISVAVVDLTDTLQEGDTVLFEGANTNFTQKVSSIQINNQNVKVAKKGQSIGVKVNERVHENVSVFKVTP